MSIHHGCHGVVLLVPKSFGEDTPNPSEGMLSCTVAHSTAKRPALAGGSADAIVPETEDDFLVPRRDADRAVWHVGWDLPVPDGQGILVVIRRHPETSDNNLLVVFFVLMLACVV